FAVHAVTRNSQDSCNVPQVPITTAFGEVPELAENHILRRCHVDVERFFSKAKFDPSASLKLTDIPGFRPSQYEVDFVPALRVDRVELEARSNRIPHRCFAQREFANRKRGTKRSDQSRFEVQNDIDISCESWFAVNATAPGTHKSIGNRQGFKR